MGAGKRPYSQETAAIGADKEMNPTITTGTASYMGASGPEPSPQVLYIEHPIWERESDGIPRTQRTSGDGRRRQAQRPKRR